MKDSLGKYSDPNRLADVMALIQVLALDEHSHRSEEGLDSELQGPPRSTKSWTELAKQHPEFFRVKDSGTHRVSLLARHVIPSDEETEKRKFSIEFTGKLLEAAISLYDREITRKERWTNLIPIAVAILAGLFSIAVALLSR